MRWALFDDVADEQVTTVLSLARRRRFTRNETVFHEGDLGDSLHLIDRGNIAVRVTTPAGDVATLRIMGAGEHFGDLAVLASGRRAATVVALERTETLELPGAVIRDFSAAHRSFEQAMTRAIALQLTDQSQVLLEAMYLPARRRVARRLVDLCNHYGGIDVPLTQDDLAGLSGTTRQTINQLLVEWRDAGIVEIGRGKVRVVDLPRLERAR